MSEHIASTLSALMDDEVSELDLRRALQSIKEDPEQLQHLRRYQAARTVMQSQSTDFLSMDISGQVSAALIDEESHSVSAPIGAGIWQAVTGFAVAASVAAVVFFVAPQIDGGGQEQAASVAQANMTMPVLSGSGAQLASQQSGSQLQLSSDVIAQQRLRQQKLNEYLSIYAKQAAMDTNSGMLPLARHASYSAE